MGSLSPISEFAVCFHRQIPVETRRWWEQQWSATGVFSPFTLQASSLTQIFPSVNPEQQVNPTDDAFPSLIQAGFVLVFPKWVPF